MNAMKFVQGENQPKIVTLENVVVLVGMGMGVGAQMDIEAGAFEIDEIEN